MVLLALAFARPLIGAKPLVSPTAAANAVRVVILDQSQSMAAVSNGVQSFERARTCRRFASRYAPDCAAI